MTALALATAELKRVTRDRTFPFFLLVLPILVILLVGLTTANSTTIALLWCQGIPLHRQSNSLMTLRPAPR
jgi:hypothetical protein